MTVCFTVYMLVKKLCKGVIERYTRVDPNKMAFLLERFIAVLIFKK